MRIDLISIFPDYFAPLRLSLVGRAIGEGLLDVEVHDLRDWTTDRHRTVDDTPYGGGAGMVMRPEPWGAALDAVLAEGGGTATVIFPTPSGARFDQREAQRLARRPRLVFACGRYEGIDARVAEDTARRVEVVELSLGDYVLSGGEVAALAMVEAIARLLPGVLGNPESLTEESHADGLLEYSAYTKPPTWRGLDVPEVLLSGHHGRVAEWRASASLARTRRLRPDLAEAQALEVRDATAADFGELLTLQRAAYVTEARANSSTELPPLTESLEELRAGMTQDTVLVARRGGRLIGSVRGRLDSDGVWYVGRLVVAPDLQEQGIGSRLLTEIEQRAPAGVTRSRLITGAGSADNLRWYRRRGYREVGRSTDSGPVEIVVLERRLQKRPEPVEGPASGDY